MLYYTLIFFFYIKIFIPNGLANLFQKNDISLRKKLSHIKRICFQSLFILLFHKLKYDNQDYKDSLELKESFIRSLKIQIIEPLKALLSEINVICYIKKTHNKSFN